MKLMSRPTGDNIQEDLENRSESSYNRARGE